MNGGTDSARGLSTLALQIRRLALTGLDFGLSRGTLVLAAIPLLDCEGVVCDLPSETELLTAGSACDVAKEAELLGSVLGLFLFLA